MRLLPVEALMRYRNGQLARGCSIVTVRQRPGTANVSVNVIVWQSILERQRREALGSSLLAVYGVWQCDPRSGIWSHSDWSTSRICSASCRP